MLISYIRGRKKGLIALLYLIMCSCQRQSTEVFICSTLHGVHNSNANYSYDDLFSFINAYRPDLIGVEMRQQDMDSSIVYLDANYPFEMFETARKYSSRLRVVGFDWLGEELEGRAIPADYWKEQSRIKELERQLQVDSLMQSKLGRADSLQEVKVGIFTGAGLRELNNGT